MRLFHLFFVPMKKVQRTICASVSLEAFTGVSPDMPFSWCVKRENGRKRCAVVLSCAVLWKNYAYTAPDNTQKQKRETQKN